MLRRPLRRQVRLEPLTRLWSKLYGYPRRLTVGHRPRGGSQQPCTFPSALVRAVNSVSCVGRNTFVLVSAEVFSRELAIDSLAEKLFASADVFSKSAGQSRRASAVQ